MSSPTECRFSDSHEWFLLNGDVVTIGISQFAANELTDITYVEMQPVGSAIADGDSAGEVESVKTTSDIISAFTGEIVEINDAVADDPSLLNSDPFGSGWLLKIRVEDTSANDALMDQSTYDDKYPV
ncbi:MAG: glycine cleavage system protein GcvH [Phycisphaerae bacterium]|jgi:glycine cleavage system H protein|nr:glycine cleavage system protein GcvH [Phycisphaerae bacterium]MBT6269773.1 glycine cleavage system protein GcvH [Phycisphaerae bacterium]MBT6281868.1 glycine cleavage system protein GcvH [Phycisphaerae bacterium]